MTIELVVHAEAQLEIEEAALWYEKRSPGLGVEFVASVDRAFAEILESPNGSPNGRGDRPWRYRLLRRFPFLVRTAARPLAVFYEIESARIVIMAVAHGRRRPGYWVSRRLE